MEVKLSVPTSLSDIKVSDYQKFIELSSEKEEDFFILQKMVQIFCNVPLIAVNRMSRNDFLSITNIISKTLVEESELQRTFTLNGVEYGFMPNLSDMELGEWIDADSYIGKIEEAHKLLAVLYRPVTVKKKDKYEIQEYEGSAKYAEEMKGASLEVLKGVYVFFWTLGSQLLRITPKYLERLIKKDKNLQADLERSGVGISTYISSLKETCLKLEKLLNFPLVKHSLS